MANEEEVKQEVYYIPENFEDAGGVLGGHFAQRNAIELMVLCGPLAYLEFKFLAFSWKTNIIIMMVTLIPLAALCAFGINGESLSQMLVSYIRFVRKRRKLSYLEFTDAKPDNASSAITFDSVLDAITSKGFKGAIQDLQKAREKRAAEQTEADPHNYQESEHTPSGGPKKRKKKGQSTPQTKAGKASSGRFGGMQGMMNSALKEKLLRKLELGDDDEDDEGFY